jgi:hypothetical protein
MTPKQTAQAPARHRFSMSTLPLNTIISAGRQYTAPMSHGLDMMSRLVHGASTALVGASDSARTLTNDVR